MFNKKFLKILVTVLGISLPVFLSAASPIVTVSETVTITIGAHNYYLLSGSNALDQLFINDAGTAFSLTLALSDDTNARVDILSPDNVDIGGTNNSLREGLSSCGASGALLTIRAKATTAVSITITPPTTGNVTCTTIGLGGGGGGGGGGSPPPAPAPAPSPPSPTPPGEEPIGEPVDVPATDKFIMPLVKLMLDKKVYKFPENKIFGTKKITKGSFALQIALAVSDLELGFTEYPGLKKIKATAIKAWPDIAKNFPKGKVSRYDFYELLLAAREISKLESKTVSDLKEACKDVKKPTKSMAQVYFTAKKFGFTGKYTGGKCRLHMPFPRKEAAKFAMKAYAIKVVEEVPAESAPPETTAPQ